MSEDCGAGSAGVSFREPVVFSLGKLSSLSMTVFIKLSSRVEAFLGLFRRKDLTRKGWFCSGGPIRKGGRLPVNGSFLGRESHVSSPIWACYWRRGGTRCEVCRDPCP